MKNSTRLDSLFSIDEFYPSRQHAYLALEEELRSTKQQLNDGEVTALIERIQSSSDIDKVLPWRLLHFAPPTEDLKQFLLQWINQPLNPRRGDALFCLVELFPTAIPAIFDRLRDEPDPEVQFRLAEYLLHSKPSEAIEWMIKLYPAIDIENADAAALYIQKFGTEQQKARIQ